MEENKGSLLKTAMASGLSMGIYWAVKYIFFMLGISSAFFNIIYLILTALVPFAAYYFTLRYKFRVGGKISFFHAWQFGVLIYFFAALIVSLEHYIFYQYLAPPGFLANSFEQTLEILKQANMNPEMLDAVSSMRLTPISMAIQGIFNNVFYGVILSIPVALIVSRRKIPKELMDIYNKIEKEVDDE